MGEPKLYRLEDALRALESLREAAGLGPELFPLPAFVGMISDEVETLRGQGKSDEEIVGLVRAGSGIEISAEDLRVHYATAEQRSPR